MDWRHAAFSMRLIAILTNCRVSCVLGQARTIFATISYRRVVVNRCFVVNRWPTELGWLSISNRWVVYHCPVVDRWPTVGNVSSYSERDLGCLSCFKSVLLDNWTHFVLFVVRKCGFVYKGHFMKCNKERMTK